MLTPATSTGISWPAAWFIRAVSSPHISNSFRPGVCANSAKAICPTSPKAAARRSKAISRWVLISLALSSAGVTSTSLTVGKCSAMYSAAP